MLIVVMPSSHTEFIKRYLRTEVPLIRRLAQFSNEITISKCACAQKYTQSNPQKFHCLATFHPSLVSKARHDRLGRNNDAPDPLS